MKTCECCGKPMTPQRVARSPQGNAVPNIHRKRFCSDRCRYKAHMQYSDISEDEIERRYQAVEFESVGGRQAWRTRIAECRTHFGMSIENRCRKVTRADGSTFTLSEYRYSAPVGQMELSL